MFFSNLISAVIRPSVAALAIAVGIATFTSADAGSVSSVKSLNVGNAVCNSALAPVCHAFTF